LTNRARTPTKYFNPERLTIVKEIDKMPRAFVLINVESGSEDEVLKELKKIEGVEEAYFSYGVYDLITKIKADTMENLKDMVTRRIRSLNKVRSTLTLIMMEE
jgi:DNA-binding Lrp family transcriptional regulator